MKRAPFEANWVCTCTTRPVSCIKFAYLPWIPLFSFLFVKTLAARALMKLPGLSSFFEAGTALAIVNFLPVSVKSDFVSTKGIFYQSGATVCPTTFNPQVCQIDTRYTNSPVFATFFVHALDRHQNGRNQAKPAPTTPYPSETTIDDLTHSGSLIKSKHF